MNAHEEREHAHEHEAERESDDSYVTFERSGIYVDLKRYLTSPAGKKALADLSKADKKVRSE